jgi:glycosyltransferase involved in cell wall biosynthesis
MTKKKLIRITTVPLSLDKLLEGQLRFMNEFYDVTAISSEKEYLQKIGKRENVVTHHLEMTRTITPMHDVIAVIKMYRYFKKEKPFIVHTHTPKAGIVGMMAAKVAGVPHRLHTVAGLPLLEATGLKRKILDFVEKLTYSCATKVYPNSKELLHIIQSNSYCENSKLKVIANGSSNGIDTSYFNSDLIREHQKIELKNQLKINENDFVFIFVGRIVSDKGINELVQAFLKLSQENNSIKLLLVGPFEEELSPLKPETLKIIKSHSSIISVGYQNDVRPYFSISNALVFPSYREGFPNVVMQAGAMNLPSIVSDINGCNEIIENNKNGIIIPVKNSNVLYIAMKEVVHNTMSYQFMKFNSRSLIENRFEQKIVWEALLNEYENLEQ